jgi:hypothetical protein
VVGNRKLPVVDVLEDDPVELFLPRVVFQTALVEARAQPQVERAGLGVLEAPEVVDPQALSPIVAENAGDPIGLAAHGDVQPRLPRQGITLDAVAHRDTLMHDLDGPKPLEQSLVKLGSQRHGSLPDLGGKREEHGRCRPSSNLAPRRHRDATAGSGRRGASSP